MKVIKRDGRKVEFDKEKIVNAINKAFIEIDGQVYEKDIANEIADEIKKLNKEITVEEIQDLVENFLMDSNRKDVARAYIRFRYKKEIAREYKDDFFKSILDKLAGTNIENSNANMDETSFGGRMGTATSEMTKRMALDFVVSDTTRKNHLNNEVYIHDLDHYIIGDHNCLTLPIDDLLAKGFNTRQTDVRPAGSISTAMQLTAVLFQIQSLNQFGGVAAGHFDWSMVPYVRKSFKKHWNDGIDFIGKILYPKNNWEKQIEDLPIDEYSNKNNYKEIYEYALKMTEKETYQAVEGLYHNLNTLQSRSGNQLPFSSLDYGSCTLPEGRMVIKALLDVSINGLGKFGKTPIFPCGIFQLGKGINRKPGDPNYDLFQLALKSTAQRLYPNYANLDWSNNAGYDRNDPKTYFGTMGCRTANLWDINGLGQQKDGRGNICPTTIILPTLAMQAKEKEGNIVDNFIEILDKKIHEAKDSLIERFEYICSQNPASAKFMYKNNTMAGYIPEEGIRSALKHGTLAIGQIGLAETLQILIGCDHTESKGMELAKKIEQLFKTRCAEFKEQYKLNFGVYYTPAEGLCYTALKNFRKKYGIIPKVSDREYFTNSIHCPVWKEMNPFEKIDIESQLTGYSSAGCITYVELESGVKYNLEALETLINYAMDKDIPYFAINVPVDECPDCGYTDDMNDTCIKCGNHNVRHLRRVTGYLNGDYRTSFNYGKQKEVEDRVKHIKY